MKKGNIIRYTIFAMVLFLQSVISIAQVPQKVSYQAVIRNVSGELVKSGSVGVKISILQGSASGTVVYSESHSTISNVNGLVTLEAGNGTPVIGTFSAINWGNGPYFLKVETDPAGGTNYTVSGISEIVSTPYALYAEGSSTTLDEAYDNGDSIIADNGPFKVTGTDGVLFGGTIGSGTIPATGAGTRLMWYPKKTAFRVGTVNSTQWDDANIGDYSMAIGENAMANGLNGTAIGYNVTASGTLSTAIGNHVSTNNKNGSCIIGDYSTTTTTNNTMNSQMMMRFAGGYQLYSSADLSKGVSIVGGKMGINQFSPTAQLEVNGTDGVLFSGTFGSGTIPATGAGTRVMWYPKKAAFRAGNVDGAQWDDANIGDYSFASGQGTTASAIYSTAMGMSTTAMESFSTAIGAYSTASGNLATAIGYNNIASGTSSTAMGNNVSTNEKGGSFIIGDRSTENRTPNTLNNQMMMRFAGGYQLYSSADLSTGVSIVGGKIGINQSSPTAQLEVNGTDGVLFGGTYGSGGTIPATGAGTRLMWYPKKAAFRAGDVDGTQWDDANIGDYSIAMGQNVVASGESGTAIGYRVTASGLLSTAIGSIASTNGKRGSCIIGDNSTPTITNNTSENQMMMRFAGGYQLFSSADLSTGVSIIGGKMGINQPSPTAQLEVNGTDGVVFGGSMGAGTIPATGAGSRLMWYPKKAAFRVGKVNSTQWDDANIGNNSIAMGENAMAKEQNCTAIGYNATASGELSTAMGSYVSTNNMFGSYIIGDYSTTTTTNNTFNNQMMMRFYGGYILYSSYNLSTGVSLSSGGNAWASISDSTKKENYRSANGDYFLSSLSKLKLGSWNYKTQDPKTFRHYGPMAQEIFHYFGNDGMGTVGCDTLLNTADMDGIMMICLQALERRTTELQNKTKELDETNKRLAELTEANKLLEERLTTVEELTKRLSAIEASASK